MTDLCDLSAWDLYHGLRQKTFSPVEVLDSCLARIETVNPTINAITALDLERARWEAQAAVEILQSPDAPPLTGIPIGIKDVNRTAGLRTTYGSLLHAEDVPTEDEGLVARLRDAGAIILGKTNTPEFAAGSNTTNKVFGATKNPYDLDRTPGGSSGGSAAALACGMVPLAHGSDTGGSLRNPATWCGVVGFRPTPGLVAREGRKLIYTHFGVQGPMARNVRDLSLMLAGFAANDARDALAAPVEATDFMNVAEVDLSKLRVAWSTDFGGIAPIDDDIVVTFRERIADLAPTFATCEERTPAFADARDIFWVQRCVSYVANHKERVEKHRAVLSPNIVSNVEAGLSMSLDDVAWAERAWSKLYSGFQEFFADIDLFIVPGNAVAPFKIADGIPKVVGGKRMENYVDASLIRSALTLTGHPVIALPCGLDKVGMPFGFQICGMRRGDLDLLAACAALEDLIRATPTLRVAPPDLTPYC
jgi:amidase